LYQKPSAKEVLKKILGKVEDIHKPIIAIFLGADEKLFDGSKAIPAKTLEEAALNAVSISKGNNYNIVQDYLRKRSIKNER